MSLARAARNGRLERAVRQARADLFLPTDRLLFVTEIDLPDSLAPTRMWMSISVVGKLIVRLVNLP